MLAPNVAAIEYFEGFESCAQFQIPNEGTPCLSSNYAFSTGGVGAGYVSAAQAHSGTKSLAVSATTGNQFRASLLSATSPDATAINCDVSSASNTADWWFRMPALPTAGRYEMGIQSTNHGGNYDDTSGTFMAFGITTAGAVEVFYEPSAGTGGLLGTLAFTAAINTWYHFSFSCTTADTLIFREETTETILITALTGTSFSESMLRMTFDIDTTTGPSIYYVDDLNYAGFSGGSAVGSRFCAQPEEGAANDWGYDYKEDASFETDPSFVGLEDAFILAGDSGDSSYLGKAFDPGSQAFAMKARVEAGFGSGEGQSVLRMAYTTGTATLSAGGTGDATGDATAAGNGQNTGNFANNIQAVLTESSTSSHWVIGIYYSAAGSALAPILGTVNYGNPINPGNFNFTVNTSPNPINGIASQTAVLLDGEGTVILSRTIPTALQNVVWKDAWLIGKGATVAEATTAVDDNTDVDDDSDSTCIFDLTGTSAVIGSSGSIPGSAVPNQPVITTTSSGSSSTGPRPAQTSGNPIGNFIAFQNTAWGFDTAFVFGGIVHLIVLIAALAASRGKAIVGLVVNLVVGGILVTLGLYPEYMIFLIALLCIGFAGGAVFQRRNSGGIA